MSRSQGANAAALPRGLLASAGEKPAQTVLSQVNPEVWAQG